MTMYQPLTEGFRELNRTLREGQVFNEQAKVREAQRQRDHAVLSSQIEDQAFNRALKEYDLKYRQKQDIWNRKFNESKLALQTQQFEHGKEIAEQELEIHRDTSKVANALNREKIVAQREATKILRQTNGPRRLTELLHRSKLLDADVAAQDKAIEEVFEGTVIREDDGSIREILNQSGKPIQMTPRRFTQLLPMLKPHMPEAMYTTVKDNMERVRKITSDLADKETLVRKLSTRKGKPKDVRNSSTLAQAKMELKQLRTQLDEANRLAGNEGNLLDIQAMQRDKREELRNLLDLGSPEAVVIEDELEELYAQENEIQKAIILERNPGLNKNAKFKWAVIRDEKGNPVKTFLDTKGKDGMPTVPGAVWKTGLELEQDLDTKFDKSMDLHIAGWFGDITDDNRTYIYPKYTVLANQLRNIVHHMKNAKPVDAETARQVEEWRSLSPNELFHVADQLHIQWHEEYFNRISDIAKFNRGQLVNDPVYRMLRKSPKFSAKSIDDQKADMVTWTQKEIEKMMGAIPSKNTYEHLMKRRKNVKLGMADAVDEAELVTNGEFYGKDPKEDSEWKTGKAVKDFFKDIFDN